MAALCIGTRCDEPGGDIIKRAAAAAEPRDGPDLRPLFLALQLRSNEWRIAEHV